MDYTAITDAVDFVDVLIGIGAVAALLAVVLVGKKGARLLLSFIK
jgi:hypothetical protein